MREELGFEPSMTTEEAFAEFAQSLTPTGRPHRARPRRRRRLAALDPGAPAVDRAASMGDAEIIPIGTRGRPGRGSATAGQALVGLARPRRPAAKTAPAYAEAVPPNEPTHRAEPDPAGTEPEARRTSRVARRRPRGHDRQDRGPLAGIPAGDWLAAFQHAAKELFGEQWEPQLARFLAFLRRRVSGDYVVDEYGFDQEVTERFFMTALRPIAQKWFRIEVRGVDNIPVDGGALVVSNHSGTIPVDGLMTMVSIHDHTGRFLRPLGADLVFKMPIVSQLARKGGTTLACNEDAERMLRGGELVGVWPEGFKGIGKPYAERYKLQRFGRGGFVSAALRTGVPIVPAVRRGRRGDLPAGRQRARPGPGARHPLHPDHAVLPAAGTARAGAAAVEVAAGVRRADPHRRVRAPGAADDPMLVFDVTDQVRETIQSTLYSLLMKRESVFR